MAEIILLLFSVKSFSFDVIDINSLVVKIDIKDVTTPTMTVPIATSCLLALLTIVGRLVLFLVVRFVLVETHL